MKYIEDGLDSLVSLIKEFNIKSIAIPPLGSGNGGLVWNDVKQVLAQKLKDTAKQVTIYVYEPSRNFATTPTQEPKLSTSALVLMELKGHLKKFNSLRLQKAAYFMDLFSSKKYFRFVAHKYGPYDHSIDIISKGIREFQQFHGTSSTKEAEKILFNKLTSESVNNTLQALLPWIVKSCDFVNSIETDHELECLATICFLIENSGGLTTDKIVSGFKNWSEEKAKRFTEQEIIEGIQKLYMLGIVEKNLVGYNLAA